MSKETTPAKRVFRSKKKLSGSRCVYRAWKTWSVGDLIIGTYRGSKIDNYDKPNWIIDVIDAQFSKKKEGEKLVGQTIGLNSAGGLDKAMEKVEEGTVIQVMYNGTSTIEKGKYAGKDAHNIEVDLVEEDTADDSGGYVGDDSDDDDDL